MNTAIQLANQRSIISLRDLQVSIIDLQDLVFLTSGKQNHTEICCKYNSLCSFQVAYGNSLWYILNNLEASYSVSIGVRSLQAFSSALAESRDTIQPQAFRD